MRCGAGVAHWSHSPEVAGSNPAIATNRSLNTNIIMIEKESAKTILQDPEKIVIDGKTYIAPPPTTATLIRVSAIIKEFPNMELTDGKQIMEFVLANAWKCGSIGLLAATLILGETKTSREKKSLKYRLLNREPNPEELAEIILTRKSPDEINVIVTQMLSRLEIVPFFALTTSLSAMNILKKTRIEVATETIASGL